MNGGEHAFTDAASTIGLTIWLLLILCANVVRFFMGPREYPHPPVTLREHQNRKK